MNATVYTDGSGTTGGPAGIAYVAKLDGVQHEKSLPLRDATNQQAEILAAAYALDQIPVCERVIVWSDSEYLVKGISEWMAGWIRRGWRTGSGSSVKNQAHWRRLLTAQARHGDVKFNWVRGHAGHVDNERADELAGAARRLAQDDEAEHDHDEAELELDRRLQQGVA